jgi:hypothetical protein
MFVAPSPAGLNADQLEAANLLSFDSLDEVVQLTLDGNLNFRAAFVLLHGKAGEWARTPAAGEE